MSFCLIYLDIHSITTRGRIHEVPPYLRNKHLMHGKSFLVYGRLRKRSTSTYPMFAKRATFGEGLFVHFTAERWRILPRMILRKDTKNSQHFLIVYTRRWCNL